MVSLLALPFHFSEAHFKVGSEGQVYRINRESGTGSSIWALRPPCRCVPSLEAGPRHRSPVSADTAVSWGGRGLPALKLLTSLCAGGLTESEADSGSGERASLWVSSRGDILNRVQVLLGKRGSVCWAPHMLSLPCIHTVSLSHTHTCLLYILPPVGKILKIQKDWRK